MKPVFDGKVLIVRMDELQRPAADYGFRLQPRMLLVATSMSKIAAVLDFLIRATQRSGGGSASTASKEDCPFFVDNRDGDHDSVDLGHVKKMQVQNHIWSVDRSRSRLPNTEP